MTIRAAFWLGFSAGSAGLTVVLYLLRALAHITP